MASPGELALARAAGIAPADTVLDSPAKTPAELRQALALGIAVNADNPQELARVDALVQSAPTASPVGLRVNPQIGGGAIGALSTATATSKFGVPLLDEGAREWVIRAFLDRPWLTRLHAHSGSQGMPLEMMARGVEATYELAEEINGRAGRRQVDTIDIGGGLPVNFGSDEESPTHAQYARRLKARVPGLLDGRYGLVTEFGRSLLAKHGTLLARVEYAKEAGGRPIAVTHAGVQVATRTVYAPLSWPLRIAAYDAQGAQERARRRPGHRGPGLLRGRPARREPSAAAARTGRPRRRAGHRRLLLRAALLVQQPCQARHLRLLAARRRRTLRRRARAADPRRDRGGVRRRIGTGRAAVSVSTT